MSLQAAASEHRYGAAHLLMRPSSSLSRTWKAMPIACWLTGRLAKLTPVLMSGPSGLLLWLLLAGV
jgi:hypothetical protein